MPSAGSCRSRRLSCTNNLAQIAKALIMHDGQFRVLPGWRNAHPALRAEMRTSDPTLAAALDANTPSWPIPLMPILERLDIHKSWLAVSAVQPVPTSTPTMPTFVCPTSPSDGRSAAQLAYAVNGGSCVVSPAAPRRQYRADGILLDAVGNPPPGVAGPTVHAGARTNLDALTGSDGTGNTLLVAEKSSGRITQSSWNAIVPLLTLSGSTVPQAIATFNSTSGSAVPVFGMISTVPAAAQKILNSVEGAPNSNHPGGLVVAFADGQTRYMRDSISPHVYAQLVTSDSEWITSGTSGSYVANSPIAQGWLGLGPRPYILSAADYD